MESLGIAGAWHVVSLNSIHVPHLKITVHGHIIHHTGYTTIPIASGVAVCPSANCRTRQWVDVEIKPEAIMSSQERQDAVPKATYDNKISKEPGCRTYNPTHAPKPLNYSESKPSGPLTDVKHSCSKWSAKEPSTRTVSLREHKERLQKSVRNGSLLRSY